MRPTIGAISSKGTANVMQHEREPLSGSERLEHHEQGETDRVGEQRLVLGVHPSARLSDPADPDNGLYETGALLPGPDATLAGPTFEEWLDSTTGPPS